MSFLLDTNVISEVREAGGGANVRAWLASVSSLDLYLSVLVVRELRRGIDRLRRRDPAQVEVCECWLARQRRDYADRVLPVTLEVAEERGRMNVPDPVPLVDSSMAAAAKVHGLTLITHNTGHLERTGVRLLHPFTDQGDESAEPPSSPG